MKLSAFKLRPYPFWVLIRQKADNEAGLRSINWGQVLFEICSQDPILLVVIVKDTNLAFF